MNSTKVPASRIFGLMNSQTEGYVVTVIRDGDVLTCRYIPASSVVRDWELFSGDILTFMTDSECKSGGKADVITLI